MTPPKRITDPAFRYTPSANTDLRRTFARIRKELALRELVEASGNNVKPLRKVRQP